MKLILSILFLLFSISVSFGQDTEKICEIRFESFTRGFQKSIVINSDSTIIHEKSMKGEDLEVKRKSTAAEWDQLMKAIPDYPLSKLDQLESPTQERASDRALHATITIVTNKNEYKSAEFDDGKPHPKLIPLTKAIKSLENQHP